MGKETTYGVWAVRSGASIFGHAEAWCKEDGKPLEFDTREAAEAYARKMNNPPPMSIITHRRKNRNRAPSERLPHRHSRIWMPAPMRK